METSSAKSWNNKKYNLPQIKIINMTTSMRVVEDTGRTSLSKDELTGSERMNQDIQRIGSTTAKVITE